jgi:small-conductance mechanosensitive channel
MLLRVARGAAALLGLALLPLPGLCAGVEAAPAHPVRVGNRTIVTLRGTLLGYAARDRARAAERRVEDLLERGAPLKVATREVAGGVAVEADGRALFLITPDDVNALLEETPARVAEGAARALELAISEAREDREPRMLLLAAARAAVATLIWALLLRGLFLASRWLGARLSHRVARRADELGVTRLTELPPGRVRGFVRRLVATAAWVLALFATSTWLTIALESFAWTRPFGEQLQGSLVELLALVAGAIVGAVPGLLVVVVIVLLTRFAVGLLRPIFGRVERGSFELGVLNRHTAAPTRRLVTAGLWLFALAMAYPYLPGAQTDAFKGLSVLAGVMVSLGASGVVGQAASGLIIIYAHALRPGEYIRVGDSEGTVVDIGMFSTRLRTGLGEEVLLPNSLVLANTTKNFSRALGRGGFVLDTSVTIGYDAPWRQVEAMLLEAARRVPSVAARPAPYVIQTALADFYVAYRLVACSEEAVPRQRMEVLNDLHAAIQDVFNEHGVQIMSPHYVLDPRAPKVVPKERWHEPPARAEGKE